MLLVQISEGENFQRIFEKSRKMGVHFILLYPSEWRDKNFLVNFSGKAAKRVSVLHTFVQISERSFYYAKIIKEI